MSEIKRISASEAKVKFAQVVADAKHYGKVTIIQNYRTDTAAVVPLQILALAEKAKGRAK